MRPLLLVSKTVLWIIISASTASSALTPLLPQPSAIVRSNVPNVPHALRVSRLSSTEESDDDDSRDQGVETQQTAKSQNNEPWLDRLENDFQALAEWRPPHPSADRSIPAALVSAGSSYTRIWTHATWKAHSDPPHQRYLRHVRKWPQSTTARKILPAVLGATGWSLVVSWVANHYWQLRPSAVAMMAGTSSAVSLLSAPLALLLTLRANASMARLLEARQAWGKLVRSFLSCLVEACK